MSLRDRMKVDWKEMTMQEKKAGVYISSAHNSILRASYDVLGGFLKLPELARGISAPNAKLSRTT